jgi:hypothetical protein
VAQRDYLAWHDDYDRPGSALHLRLLVVQDLLSAALDERPEGPVRVISICAGQARDVVTVARRHRRGPDMCGRLVELDPRNADEARAAIERAGLARLEVVQADAGQSDAYLGAAPADVVLACGIFGNITDEEVEHTIGNLPALCAPDAWVIWTRGPRDDGILDTIEEWFVRAGLEPVCLVVGQGHLFGVGAARFRGTTPLLHGGTTFFGAFYR